MIGLARMTRDPRDRRAQPAGAAAARRDQPRGDAGGRRRTGSTTRPTRPASRCARSAATSPRTPAAPTASSTASPPTTCSRSRWCWPTARWSRLRRVTARLDLLGAVVGSEGTLGHRHRGRRCGCCRRPSGCATLLAAFALDRRGGRGGLGDHRRRHRAGGDRDDGRAHHRGRRGGGRTPASRWTPAPCCWSSSTGPRSRSSDLRRRSQALCSAAGARERAGGARRRRAGARSGAGRKAAFAAMGRLSPDYYVQDGVVPRTRLPETLRRIEELSAAVRPAGRQRVPRRRRQPAPAGALRRPVAGEAERAEQLASEILDGLRRGGRLAHRRARHRRSTRPVHDAAHVLGGRPGRDAPPALRRSTRTGSATRARSSRRRGCAARCPGPYRAPPAGAGGGGGAMVIEHERGRPDLHGRGAVAAGRAAGSRSAGTARCWRSTRRAPSGDRRRGVRGRAVRAPRAPATACPATCSWASRCGCRTATVVHGGGKVVKNVAGYDLPRLVVGAEGGWADSSESDRAPASAARRDVPPRRRAGRSAGARAAGAGLRRVRVAAGRTCSSASRARPPHGSPRQARALVGGEVVEDDEPLWAEHREAAAGLHVCTRSCRPTLGARSTSCGHPGRTRDRRPARPRLPLRRRAKRRPTPSRCSARAAGGGGVRWLRRSTRELSTPACTAGSACRPARPIRCGATSPTRRAGGST